MMNKMIKIIGLFLIAFALLGCPEYDRGKSRCQKECKKIQENNIGARFMWSDIDRTFGKCTCYAEDGSRKRIYIKTK